ncbi:hypothetical protein DFJ74DRAFT_695799 [Hyaloraphidium curvatum]|nr:hypothetical protein DFJ74DRAFT_695799 [Hyaloraphidium curvatum]
MRVPGEDSCPLEGCSADDAPFLNIFVSVFWASVTAALNFTAASGIPSVVDVVAEFPTAPPPVAALQTAPALSQSSSTPVIHFTPPPFRALEYLGWIDPPDGLDPVPASSRALVLDRCLGGIKAENGLFLLNPLVAQLLQKISDYSSWLRNGAGLRQLDVLALVARSTNSDPQAVRSRDLYMAEALRRRTALLQAVELIDGALPADVSDAVDGADFVAIATAFSSSAPNALVLALAVLTKLKQLSLLLCCPDPFEDLVGAPEAPKEAGPRKRTDLLHRAPTGSDTESDVSSAPSVVSSESADLFSWLSSPAFAVASRSAAIIASIMRTVCERVPASELEANYLASHFLCTAAVHGAWFPLLLLRRFDALALSRSLGCRLPAESMKLHAELRSDAAACLSAMERCGLPQYQSARLILQSVLDGEDARFGLADIRVLRMASRVVAGCPHSGDVGQGGECYLCTAERARERRPSYRPPEARMDSDDEGGACERGEGGNATDPLADAAVLGASARRRVRFTGSDDVRDTWSASEYPGRSPTAGEEPDETDEGVLPAGPLGVLISQRKRAVGRAVGAEAAEMPWGD